MSHYNNDDDDYDYEYAAYSDPDSDRKNNKKWKIFLGMTILALFGGMGYGGYVFISEAERSAAGITKDPNFNKKVDLDINSSNMPTGVGNMQPNNTNIIVSDKTATYESSGQDLSIEGGEFEYKAGQPVVKIMIHNRGSFPISGLTVNLALYLNNETKEAFASEIAAQVNLPSYLPPDTETVVRVPVSGDSWQSEAVRLAKSRKLIAKINSVNDDTADQTEYTQTTDSVSLRQVGNDWSSPSYADKSISNQSNRISEQPAAFADPTAGMNLNPPPSVQPVQLDPMPPVPDLPTPRDPILDSVPNQDVVPAQTTEDIAQPVPPENQ